MPSRVAAVVRVTIELPSLLGAAAGGERSIGVEADTLAGALAALVERHPALDTHLFDEAGGLRQHVLCFLNERNSRWLESQDVELSDGDTITILQAVSGG